MRKFINAAALLEALKAERYDFPEDWEDSPNFWLAIAEEIILRMMGAELYPTEARRIIEEIAERFPKLWESRVIMIEKRKREEDREKRREELREMELEYYKNNTPEW